MKIEILQEKLKQGIQVIEKVSQKSLSLPILQNVLLNAENNFLGLEATNLETGIKWWSLAKVEKDGKALAPIKIFSSLIGLSPNKKLSLFSKKTDIVVECQDNKTTLKGFDPNDFPIIPQPKEGGSVSVESALFCSALSQIVDIASLSGVRPEISGIYFLFQEKELKMAATDSFRLGEKRMPVKKSFSGDVSMILPQQAAREIVSIFGEKEGALDIYFSPNQVLFESIMAETKHPQIQLVSKLIEGDYPNYQEIIPQKSDIKAVLKKEEFLNQVKAAGLFGGKSNEVNLKVNPEKKRIEIFSQSSELGEYESFLSGDIKGNPLSISFNYKFLLDGISKIKGEDIVFELTNEEGPGVLKQSGKDDFFYVLMPIKAN
ncbi:MAG: DNA polymerase III subunit beta [Candidatus Nealsonbacteria bacterium CG23_combo_of_CG06-09_8_20_14_all_39_17]|uniref:Beta sliding clamp n=1 Tax=Candidatus Nealsonbacteria bacterium CG23_combo_of_CG06-09_8_20_14_all_39_17 TaxID=1974722 RepID=A0A2G9YVU7_9BACT|nr:MAG: DNA polymerase III subunit beta [Candidatus Nealsonbacteria bacterium CG23_combo_of_CG06-09_8_20_14_all_39_17]PIU44230.1 MAG: DNA polymerase III subunit beta [Candidatus Nealsonbacteria bacterium CG07_land_8_20_14_0_80_39_13]